MSTNFEIRSLQAADAPRLAALAAEIFSDPWTQNNFCELSGRENCISLLACAGEAILGFATLSKILEEGDVDYIFVAPGVKGQGIGTVLLEELLSRARAAGVKEFTLEVRASNQAAIHLYKKFHFVCEGIRPRFYTKPVEDAMIMWRRQQANK